MSFHATDEIIEAANHGKLPNQIMFTFPPRPYRNGTFGRAQRWSDDLLLWSKELVIQNLKNMVKRFLVR